MAEKDIASATGSGEAESGQFGPQKIYIKDIAFKTPHSPEIFTEKWEPVINMDLNSKVRSMGDKLYEVVLSVTVTVGIKEKVAYSIETQQAGIFRIDGFSDQAINRMVATICPNILFPFVREHVADLVLRSGFPQLLLAPVNFEILYQQQQNVVASAKPETKH